MKYAQIRQAFTSFFQDKNHQLVDSSSLIPHNDPTLMFTNAGMNQFKDVFLGQDQRDYQRAVSVQKCLRAGGKHNDLENVGFTARHHTFFEMLGNFSFGDYFKKEAIAMAWEFLTEVLKIPKERLYVTVFTTDDEAAEIWNKDIGVPLERISRFGEKDNFWRMGQTGPCGPCSEIFYDHNPSAPPVPLDQDEDRFVEIWNLVFMQFYEDESGQQTPLPKPSVDTGAGIERIAAAMQGVTDNYQSDVFTPLIKKACELSGLKYDWQQLKQNPEQLGSLKVVADHARAAAFLISEGVVPSNEGRGYVLRRIMRRAIRYGRKLNQEQSVYLPICEQVIESMGEFHPLLLKQKDFIINHVKKEKERFLKTLDRGSEILNGEIIRLKQQGANEVDGITAFTLYDTYGFPLDLTQVIAKENGMAVNEQAFQHELEKAKDKARQAQKSHGISANDKHLAEWTTLIASQSGTTEFLGFDKLNSPAQALALSDGSQDVTELKGLGFAVFQHTPFYAEGGGQVGDEGEIFSNEELIGRVLDCRKLNDVFIHQVQLEPGQSLHNQESYELKVASARRQATANNHSATHLLHAALKKVLGDHVSQAGSLVNGEKLRFDFSHGHPLTHHELVQIESLVNQQISLAQSVNSKVQSHQEALDEGAVAMFGEKYGEQVRVISMGSFSKELCGGTHVKNTAEIRLFKILAESGVAAGVRRIEAITGDSAFHYLNQMTESFKAVGSALNLSDKDLLLEPLGSVPTYTDFSTTGKTQTAPTSSPAQSKASAKAKNKVVERIETLLEENKQLKHQLQQAKAEGVSSNDLLGEAIELESKGQKLSALFTRVDIDDRGALSEVVDRLRAENNHLALTIIGEGTSPQQPKPIIVAMGKGLKNQHAGQILRELCQLLEGKGGGRPDFAQGSVSNLDRLKAAKELFYERLRS
jgi:alanyl-tRNA synthetase